jgi:putative SOS response-associated peptidase YedK
MCGRYTISKLEQILKQFKDILQLPSSLVPRFNVAPTQAIPVIANNHPDRMEMFHWGLVPSWAKDMSIGSRMINARAETLAEKPAFRTALVRRRCLIPADGFYEWRKEKDRKTTTPMHIQLKAGRPFAFAGLWDVWHSPDGSWLPSCTIITTRPNELMASIHDRMPAILLESAYAQWLCPDEQPAEPMAALLQPYPAEPMQAHPVSRQVNSPKNEGPSLIEPVPIEVETVAEPTLFDLGPSPLPSTSRKRGKG